MHGVIIVAFFGSPRMEKKRNIERWGGGRETGYLGTGNSGKVSHVATDAELLKVDRKNTWFWNVDGSQLFAINDEEIGRGTGEAGMATPCDLDYILLSGSVDIFGDPRKLGYWPSLGRTSYFSHCPGSAAPSGAKEVQAAAAAVQLNHLGLVTLKLSGMQFLRKHLELVGCGNRYILGTKGKVKVYI